MNHGNLAKIYLIATREVNKFSASRVVRKKRGEKCGMSCAKLSETNGEKMSAFRLSTMLMKTN
jgi:hypothetical protein